MKTKTERIIQLEFYSLCLLAISLPIFEASKNIACLLYLIFFIYRSTTLKNTYHISAEGKYILIYMVGSSIAAIGAIAKGYDSGKVSDIIRYSLIGLMILHTPLNKSKINIILGLLFLSSLIGVIHAYFLLSSNTTPSFKLHSVGHINHSSIYLLLTIGAILPFLLNKNISKKLTAAVIILALIYIFALFKTNSRATFIGLVITVGIFLILAFLKLRKTGYILMAILASTSLYLYSEPPKVFNKFVTAYNAYDTKLSPREKIWTVAFMAWKKEPFFGVGYGNYKIITAKKMTEWYKGNKTNFSDKNSYLYSSHAHNRYLNSLVEGGIIGGVSVLILLFGLAYRFSKYTHLIQHNNLVTYWAIGANTLIITSIVGLFNTTLHHEHGLLSMILIGLSFKYLINWKAENET